MKKSELKQIIREVISEGLRTVDSNQLFQNEIAGLTVKNATILPAKQGASFGQITLTMTNGTVFRFTGNNIGDVSVTIRN